MFFGHHQPLPTLVPASTSEEQTMKDSLLGCVLQSRALLLCNVVRGFLEAANTNKSSSESSNGDGGDNNNDANSKKEQLPAVVVTGGDADIYTKLLQPHHSYVVETTPQNELLLDMQQQQDNNADADAAENNNNKRFQLHNIPNLFSRAVQGVLQAQHRQWNNDDKNNNTDAEKLRHQLLGQRVATRSTVTTTTTTASPVSGSKRVTARQQQQQQQQSLYKQGTILSVRHRGAALDDDEDKFAIFFDDAEAADEDWGVGQIYGALRASGLYCLLLFLAFLMPFLIMCAY